MNLIVDLINVFFMNFGVSLKAFLPGYFFISFILIVCLLALTTMGGSTNQTSKQNIFHPIKVSTNTTPLILNNISG